MEEGGTVGNDWMEMAEEVSLISFPKRFAWVTANLRLCGNAVWSHSSHCRENRQTEAMGTLRQNAISLISGEVGTVTLPPCFDWRGADRGGERRKEKK